MRHKIAEQPERCKHGVWAADRCEDCVTDQPVDCPESDATDAAHPAWWRGHEYASRSVCLIVNEILDGKQPTGGVSNEPWESTKKRLNSLASGYTPFKCGDTHCGDCPCRYGQHIKAPMRESVNQAALAALEAVREQIADRQSPYNESNKPHDDECPACGATGRMNRGKGNPGWELEHDTTCAFTLVSKALSEIEDASTPASVYAI